jgi:drug/metabolite transporter (DMT)-like permease
MWASLIAALLSAFCYGIASVMQAMAVRSASRRPARIREGDPAAGRIDPSLLVRLLGYWRFIISIGIDLLAFIAQLVALHRLPLFAVQAVIAANLAVTAVFATWLIGVKLGWREWLAVGGVVAGVGLLGSSAGAQGAATVGTDFQVALMAAVIGIAAVGMAAARLTGRARTLALGATAGLGFAVLAVAARILPGFSPSQLVHTPASYTLVAAGVVSFLMYASALEGGSVTVATAVVVLTETVPPAIVGVIFLGDSTRHGLAGLAAAGFVLAVASAVVLARFGEGGEQPRGRPGGAPAQRPGGRSQPTTPLLARPPRRPCARHAGRAPATPAVRPPRRPCARHAGRAPGTAGESGSFIPGQRADDRCAREGHSAELSSQGRSG